MDHYSLSGVDGNALSLIAYTRQALYFEGYRDLAKGLFDEATTGTYDHVIMTCLKYLDIANQHYNERTGANNDDENEI